MEVVEEEKNMKDISKRLPDAEFNVMKVIWNLVPPITTNKITNKLADNTWKPQTLLTVLKRLSEKGFLNIIKDGKEHQYEVLIKEDEYLDKFVAFQKRWNELLPDLPLYSNQYYDFFNSKLKGYEGIKDAIWDITSQLVYCWIQE